jgi:hypothetical protein
LLVRAGSAKVKTNIVMKNNSHQPRKWGVEQIGQRIYTIRVHHRGIPGTKGQDSHKQDSEGLQSSECQLVLPTAPNSSTAFSSTYHIIFNAYTSEVQETPLSQIQHGRIPRRVGDPRHLPRDSITESGATTEPEQRGHSLLRLVNDLKLLIINGIFERAGAPPPLTTKKDHS